MRLLVPAIVALILTAAAIFSFARGEERTRSGENPSGLEGELAGLHARP